MNRNKIGYSEGSEAAGDISKDGKWFRDSHGRYLLFRGVNFASRSKLPPYLPIAPIDIKNLNQLDLEKEIELASSELDLLKHLGFNIVRLLISWKAIESRPNPNLDEEILPEGREYLTAVSQIIDELYSRGLYVILDFHQDIANEIFGGDGFPDWALAIDDKHKRPLIDDKHKRTAISNLKAELWQRAYLINNLVRHTLRSFWNNDLTNHEAGLRNYPVRTHLEKTIGQTVKFFKSLNNDRGHPAILGIEPFNEPHPVGIPPQKFESEFLFEYYINVESEIRRFDKNIFLFIEPRVDWTVSSTDSDKSGSRRSLFDIKRTFNLRFIHDTMIEGKVSNIQLHSSLPSDSASLETVRRRGVLSFHYYNLEATAGSFLKIPENLYRIKREFPYIFAQLVEAATERELIPFLTEFGGFQESPNIREYINLHFNQIEKYLINATYWNYDLYHTAEGKDNWNLENYSILGPNRTHRNLDVIARPYPIRSSAEPTLLFFDIESKYAAIILKGTVVDAPTIIYVPYHFHYSPEFRVWATSKEIEWDKENQLLYWYLSKDQSLNQIILAKEQEQKIDSAILPERCKNLLERTTFVNSFA